jgi:hypothetical protein
VTPQLNRDDIHLLLSRFSFSFDVYQPRNPIEYEGALYPLLSRGNECSHIFIMENWGNAKIALLRHC